jgi:predicted ATPase
VKVLDNGDFRIESSSVPDKPLRPEQLSSGEKQLLILLTQALLCEREPVVYVADEPELSLHVTWQEKLISSILQLGGQIQVIVATHSPDIVGPYRNKVVDLGKLH